MIRKCIKFFLKKEKNETITLPKGKTKFPLKEFHYIKGRSQPGYPHLEQMHAKTLAEWFSKGGPQSSNSIAWNPMRSAGSQAPQTQ